MATQLTFEQAKTEQQRLAAIRLDLTAKERHQLLTVETLAAMLVVERKALRAIQKEKRKAEDAEEFHRAGYDLEPA